MGAVPEQPSPCRMAAVVAVDLVREQESKMRPSPVQTVKKNFENRAKLVDQLADMVDKQHGDTSREQVRARLMGLSNTKLLRLYRVEQKVRERFGDRAKLVEHIMTARKNAGMTADDAIRTQLDGFTKARLLDLAAMKHGEKPAKMTAEEKARRRRGRKQKERAASAKAKGKA
jgi:hypothetical protein